MATTALILRFPSLQRTAAPLMFTEAFTVGRGPQCSVRVDHSLVSRIHLMVEPTPDGWYVSCQGRNGMLVDGLPTQGALVNGATRIHLGGPQGPVLSMDLEQHAPTAPVVPPPGAPSPRPAPVPVSMPAQRPTPTDATTTTLATTAPADDLGATTRVATSGTIGRAPDNALVINDPMVSAYHARIDVTPQGTVVSDLRSTNGVWVGQQRVTQMRVTQPTTFGMGSTFVVICPDGTCEIQVATAGGELVGKDLTFSVNDGRLTLLDSISFALPGNELLAVVGPSGAGKSTLLKALTGEQKAQRGQVLFDGLDVYEHYPVMRNKIGVVPQNDVVHAALTVRQTLEYAAELRFAKDVTRAERRQRIDQVLEDLDLGEHVDKRVKKLSGGQRKRVSTAIELLTSPSLLFLDEPTSGLDPQLDRDVMELLATLAHGTRPGDTGRTVMVVTHNENHIDRADKVLILAAGGKPVYYGAPAAILPYFAERLRTIRESGRLRTRSGNGEYPDPQAITGFADVYALIRNHTPELRGHLEATVPETRPGWARATVTGTTRGRDDKAPQQSALRQVSTLARRHLRLIIADPSYLVFMLLLPAIMGLLTKAIKGADGFALVIPSATATTTQPHTSPALSLLVVLITGAAFSGMSVTVRELIGERDVFLREAAVGLRPGAYLAAKTLILALIVTVQTALMMGVALALNKAPSDPVLLGSPSLELAIACWGVAFASGLLGLAISAFVSSSEQVMPVLVVAIMGQLVLAGGVIEVAGQAVFEQLAWLMPSRWGYAMAASTVDLNQMVPYRADDLWAHTAGQWLMNAGCMAAIGLVCLLACHVGLVRRARR